MAKRTISGGFETYRRASDGEWSYGMLGDQVDVHKDDVERFDRLHPAVPEVEETEDPEEVVIPEGDPSMDWKVAELEAFAVAKGIDLTGPNTKPEKLAVILEAITEPTA